MMRNRIVVSAIIGVMFVLSAFGLSSAQQQTAEYVLYQYSSSSRWPGLLRLWAFDEQTHDVTLIADIQRHWQGVGGFIADEERQRVYVIERDDDYAVLGTSRLVEYDWGAGTRNVVYARFNLAYMEDHPDPDKLVLWYYAPEVISPNHNTPVYGCLFDISAQVCHDFGEPFGERAIRDWVWLNDTEVLRRNPYVIWGVERIDVFSRETTPVHATSDVYFIFWHETPSNDELFMAWRTYDALRAGENIYDLYRLQLDTLEVFRLPSINFLYGACYRDLSPDGHLWAVDLCDFDGEHTQRVNFVVVDVEIGQFVFSHPLRFQGPSDQQLTFYGPTQWPETGTRVLRTAESSSGDTTYVVSIDIRSGLIVYLAELDNTHHDAPHPGSIRFAR